MEFVKKSLDLCVMTSRTEILVAAVDAAMAELSTLPSRGFTKLKIDIGANLDPITSGDNETIVLAIEPVVHAKIARRPRMIIVPAAVGETDGVANLTVYGSRGGMSRAEASSLTPLRAATSNTFLPGVQLPVPLLSARRLLSSIPKEISLVLLKTDAQNYDFKIVQATGGALRRAVSVKNEVDLKAGAGGGYNASNDICNDFMPLMSRQGFRLTCLITGRHARPVVIARTSAQLEDFCLRRQQGTGATSTLARWWGDAYWSREASSPEERGPCDPKG